MPNINESPFETMLKAGAPMSDTMRLAIIVKCAHSDSDVGAGIRVEHALAGYGSGLAPYLNGSHFAAFVDDNMALPDLNALREHAHAFYDAHATRG